MVDSNHSIRNHAEDLLRVNPNKNEAVRVTISKSSIVDHIVSTNTNNIQQ